MKSLKYCLLILVSSIFLSACGGTSGSAKSANGGDDVGGVMIGVLPNGSQVWVSQDTFTVPTGESTSGSLTIIGGTPNESFTFTPTVSPTGPTVATVPAPCVLISGQSHNHVS